MTPVLAVKDPAGALRHLTQVLGLARQDDQSARFGDQVIRLCQTGAPPEGMIARRLDHVALRIGDADRQHQHLAARGARLSAAFTPSGPAAIAEFWDHGVRYVFFDGPEGWPVEFCARNGRPDAAEGHDHLAIRSDDLDGVERELTSIGAQRIARHLLAGADRPVEVRFLALGAATFELFDEAPLAGDPGGRGAGGWIGFLPA